MYRLTLITLLMACKEEPRDSGLAPGASEAPEGAPALGRCDYSNAFTGELECKQYSGEAWSDESAANDCENELVGAVGVYSPGLSCDVFPLIGTCVVVGEDDLGYEISLGGDSSELCSGAELACTSFAAGEFVPTDICEGDEGGEDDHIVFIWPYETCEPPVEGDEALVGDGEVCVWNSINGCVQEGLDFRDYGSCDVVATNRPYYPKDPAGETDPADPRLEDAAYLAELDWVRSQAESCACVCCHSEQSPQGPSIFGVDSQTLWTDMMSDIAVGMFAGYIDSSALGWLPPEENNGFEREISALPTTDTERMMAFWQAEFDRRGLSPEDMSEEPPIGGPLVEQANYELPDCPQGEGISAEGRITWLEDYPARYLYVLEEGSENPGVPPNFDMPEGTIWRLDVPYGSEAFEDGLRYGEVPASAVQIWPEQGAPPALRPGRYHLYALYDIALPISRCVFEVKGAEEAGGCQTLPAGAGLAGLAPLAALLWRRRRR